MGAKRPENFPYYSGSLYSFQCWDLKSYPGFFSSAGIWNPGTRDFLPVLIFFYEYNQIKLTQEWNVYACICINVCAYMCINVYVYMYLNVYAYMCEVKIEMNFQQKKI